MRQPLYLDHPASTRSSEEVIDAMLPWLRDWHANPHSDNLHGQKAANAVAKARSEIASLIGANSGEIVFTSGATEANNLALRGLWRPGGGVHGHIALSPLEHKSLLETANDLVRTSDIGITKLRTDSNGLIDPNSIQGAIQEKAHQSSVLVSCAHANNELGSIQSLSVISEVTREIGGYFHVDAAQSFGKIPLDVSTYDIDMASLSSHKIYGPAGIGALFVASHIRPKMHPVLTGGGQEGGLRSGTVPVFLAVGFGCAASIAAKQMEEDQKHLASVVSAFLSQLQVENTKHLLLSPPSNGLPGLVTLRLPGVEAPDLLDRVASHLSASTGSACNAGDLRTSHVLRSIGLSGEEANQVVRFGFGRGNTPEQARWVAQKISESVRRINTQF